MNLCKEAFESKIHNGLLFVWSLFLDRLRKRRSIPMSVFINRTRKNDKLMVRYTFILYEI